jgi:hypothetical protein
VGQPRQHTERLKSEKRLWEKRAKSISGKSNCKDFFLISNVIFFVSLSGKFPASITHFRPRHLRAVVIAAELPFAQH